MNYRQSCFCRGGSPLMFLRKASTNRPQGCKRVTRCYKESEDPKNGIALLADARIRTLVDNISGYCSSLPNDDNEAEDCWTAYQFLLNELKSAEEECVLNVKYGEKYTKACKKVEHWEDFLRESEDEGTINTVHVLKTLNKAKLHKEDAPNTKELSPKDKKMQDFAAFFHVMDKDGDGRLNVEEFRSSMKRLGDELHGPMVETILEAVSSSYGFLDFDEFMAVVEAEEIRSHSRLAAIIRQGHLHQKEHKWWSE
ncbi:hypothetical protein BSKO_14036 [Bryopsis sp. KO-2023]|nr:hypothetical protein BSKO_14036 [Bryopsis sp. KO-2023]